LSDHFSRIPLELLLRWVLHDVKNHTLFGIHEDLFFRQGRFPALTMKRFGQHLDTPLGVAAGPHSQMAQNIITAWAVGARFIELKTIQTLDRLHVSKPCIDMEDEGYNCEWSQELTCEDSFDEYLNAWIIIHILKHRAGSHPSQPGFIFNMSVGYDMAGILKDNVQRFLEKMNDASALLARKIELIRPIYPEIDNVHIPAQLSNNVTLSTMHGCPPDEIETIAAYLMTEKNLHTAIKLNPTLLGAKELRKLLNDLHQFPVDVPDEAFAHDPRFEDAVSMISRLRKIAGTCNRHFGLKLTNTLESKNKKNIFPPKEHMAYLSGRALHPISIHVAARLQNHFQGTLDISFAGGADCFNVVDILASGMKPVTVCSDLLKPGGYARLKQYTTNLLQWPKLQENLKYNKVTKAQLKYLNDYASKLRSDGRYTKTPHSWFSIKTERTLNHFDCISAPCVGTCPSGQEIPQYMRAVAKGDFNEAHAIIMRSNPFPAVTGLVCDHACQSKCTRQNYDAPLQIREIKRIAEAHHDGEVYQIPIVRRPESIAVIGAGPSGLSAAYILSLNGFQVHIFEESNRPGGMVSSAIPMFRLTKGALERDVERIVRLGGTLVLNHPVNNEEFEHLRSMYDMVYISVGASIAKKLHIPGEEAKGVFNQLQFLKALRSSEPLDLGRNVVILGGGNSAIDAARSASRLIPQDGRVRVVYRRTRKEMPAEIEEIEALSDEGVEIVELTSPLEIMVNEGQVAGLKCQGMKLGTMDQSGRRRPEPVPGKQWIMEVDSVITAIGQDVALDFAPVTEVDPVTLKSNLPGVFMGGDAFRGAATIIQAVADGIKAADNMIKEAGYTPEPLYRKAENRPLRIGSRQKHSATRTFPHYPEELPLDDRKNFKQVRSELSVEDAIEEAQRCLSCDLSCDVCVTVCPNRANFSYMIRPVSLKMPVIRKAEHSYEFTGHEYFQLSQKHQVLNIGDFCNECGNCTTFCPTSGNPYRDKPKFYLTRESFEAEQNGFFLTTRGIEERVEGDAYRFTESPKVYTYETPLATITFSRPGFKINQCMWHTVSSESLSLLRAAKLKTLWTALKGSTLTSV